MSGEDLIDCEGHGKQPVALICRHLAEAETEEAADIGFHWSAADGDLVANCDACEAEVGDDGFLPDDYVYDNFVLICRLCFTELAADHGVEAGEIETAEAAAAKAAT